MTITIVERTERIFWMSKQFGLSCIMKGMNQKTEKKQGECWIKRNVDSSAPQKRLSAADDSSHVSSAPI